MMRVSRVCSILRMTMQNSGGIKGEFGVSNVHVLLLGCLPPSSGVALSFTHRRPHSPPWIDVSPISFIPVCLRLRVGPGVRVNMSTT